VENGTLRSDPDKITALAQIALPTSTTELRSFLGIANFHRRFISEFSLIAAPLYSLLKGNPETLNWDHNSREAFDKLKQAAMQATALTIPDLSQPFVITVDASNTGIGGVLSQDNKTVKTYYRNLQQI